MEGVKMNCQAHFEIHFQNENQASALLKTNSEGRDKDFCELLIFSYFACRQMHNLKPNKVSKSLAQILSLMYSGAGDYSDYWQLMTKLTEVDIPYYLPFLAALGINVSKLVGLIPSLGLYRATSKLTNEQFAQQICPIVPQVNNHRSGEGQKQFIINMELRDKRVLNFDLQPKGFGMFGKGVNYYAPMSVILTFKYLYSLHDDWEPENSRFRKMLIKCANLCGTAFLQGKITTVSQVTLPLEIVNSVNVE
jgi:hypothetical protein